MNIENNYKKSIDFNEFLVYLIDILFNLKIWVQIKTSFKLFLEKKVQFVMGI